MLIIIALALLFLFAGLTFLFTSPSLSPVPYFPTNKKDLHLVLEAIDLKNNQIVFDLGAGDGIVLFEAAKKAYKEKLDTQFIGIEINPILVLILQIRRLFHPNKKNIKILLADMFKLDYHKFIKQADMESVFYMYISPWYLEKVVKQITLLGNPSKIVSYMYSIKSLSEIQETIQGLHKIYCYKVNKATDFLDYI